MRGEQVSDEAIARYLRAEAYAQVRGPVEELVRELKPVVYERRLAHPSGEEVCLEIHLIPQFDDQGVLLGSWVLVYDITRHRVAERRLRESEARLDKFMRATVEGILFHRDGVMTDVNAPLCEMTGWPRHELIGKHVMDFVAEDEVPKVREVMRLHTARLADAAARHADAERHSAEKFSQAERHAGEMLALQGQMIPKIAEVTEAATALSGVAEALTDARETFDRATPLSTHAPPPRASRGAKP